MNSNYLLNYKKIKNLDIGDLNKSLTIEEDDFECLFVQRDETCWIDIPHRLKLSRNLPILWIYNRLIKCWVPYWIDEKGARMIDLLIRKKISLNDVDLSLQYILNESNLDKCLLIQKKKTIIGAISFLRDNSYVLVKDILPKTHIVCIQNYVRKIFDSKLLAQKDFSCNLKSSRQQNDNELNDCNLVYREVIYNENFFRFLHTQLTTIISEITQEKLNPSFCFLAKYRKGIALNLHRDRKECHWNISILFDHDSPFINNSCIDNSDFEWPLIIQHNKQYIKVNGKIGDLIIYQGHQITHGRETLTKASHATVCSFHYSIANNNIFDWILPDPIF